MATGSHDYDTKLWDFGGMDSRLKPFKSFEANGNSYVRGSLSPQTSTLFRSAVLVASLTNLHGAMFVARSQGNGIDSRFTI